MAGKFKSFHLVWTHENLGNFKYMVYQIAMDALKIEGFEAVLVTLGGPVCKMVADAPEIQAGLMKMSEAGIRLRACEETAERHTLREKFAALGIEVMRLPEQLSDYRNGPDEKLMIY